MNPDGTPGYTWNPITGCLNGCEYCYARKLANTRLKERYLANDVIGETDPRTSRLRESFADPFHPRFWEDRTSWKEEQSLRGKKPMGIFTCDMSDLFGIGVPEMWQAKVFGFINLFPEHRFYLLTKQPQNLIKFSPFPDNCWVGVSATDDAMVTHAVVGLDYIDAKIKYLSLEPLLKWDMSKIDLAWTLETYKINWLIIGAQTKPTVYPKLEWVREIVEACDKAEIPVFQKNNLKPLLGDNLRQELPQ